MSLVNTDKIANRRSEAESVETDFNRVNVSESYFPGRLSDCYNRGSE